METESGGAQIRKLVVTTWQDSVSKSKRKSKHGRDVNVRSQYVFRPVGYTPNFPHPSKMSNRESLAKMPVTWAFPGAGIHLWNLHEQK